MARSLHIVFTACFAIPLPMSEPNSQGNNRGFLAYILHSLQHFRRVRIFGLGWGALVVLWLVLWSGALVQGNYVVS